MIKKVSKIRTPKSFLKAAPSCIVLALNFILEFGQQDPIHFPLESLLVSL